jgi:hypothetical protein
MPDYSDEEIDKASDELSEVDELLVDGKLVPRALLNNEIVRKFNKICYCFLRA